LEHEEEEQGDGEREKGQSGQHQQRRLRHNESPGNMARIQERKSHEGVDESEKEQSQRRDWMEDEKKATVGMEESPVSGISCCEDSFLGVHISCERGEQSLNEKNCHSVHRQR
jgi:hypothetical protein